MNIEKMIERNVMMNPEGDMENRGSERRLKMTDTLVNTAHTIK